MKPIELTPEQIARAKEIQDQVLYIDANSTTMYWILGELCLEVQKNKLWRALGVNSFTQWLKTHLAKSRSTVMSAIRSVKMLTGLADKENLRKIPRASAELLCRLSESQRVEWVGKSWVMSPQEFKKAVESTLTPLEKQEDHKRVVLNPTISQFQAWEQGFARVAQEVGQAVTREAAIEYALAQIQPSILDNAELEAMMHVDMDDGSDEGGDDDGGSDPGDESRPE